MPGNSSLLPSTITGARKRAVRRFVVWAEAEGAVPAAIALGMVGQDLVGLSDFPHDGTQSVLRFPEKGGKSQEVPVRHDLEEFILA